MANFVAIDGAPDQLWLPWMVHFAASGPPINILMLLLQIPSTGLGRSVYVLPKCLTGCWLEATSTGVRLIVGDLMQSRDLLALVTSDLNVGIVDSEILS